VAQDDGGMLPLIIILISGACRGSSWSPAEMVCVCSALALSGQRRAIWSAFYFAENREQKRGRAHLGEFLRRNVPTWCSASTFT
jgi:predicted alpha/beta-hydrolase family hydrolase